MIAKSAEIIQDFSILFILAAFVFQYLQVRQKKNLMWHVPMFFFLFHSITFYLVLSVDRYTPFSIPWTYTDWSAVLRLHGFITIAIIEAGRYFLCRGRKE